MTYRSLTQPAVKSPPKRKTPRTGKNPAGYFKKEEGTYMTFGGHEAVRMALDYMWTDLLEAEIKFLPGVEDTDWWVQEPDPEWVFSSEGAERWAILFHFAADARRRLANEASYVAVNRDTLEWKEIARGADAQILWEDVSAD